MTMHPIAPHRLDQLLAGLYSDALGDARAAVRYAETEIRALERAGAMLAAGVIPEQLAGGAWRVRSAAGDGAYVVARNGACSCPAGAHGRTCKHALLVMLAERAIDALDDTHDDELDDQAAARHLFDRLAVARRRALEREVAP